MKRATVVIFPGTNCDHDVAHVFRSLLGCEVAQVWHKDRDLKNPDLVIVPGGFAYGDYLRTGALAKLSPVMDEVVSFSKKGGPVIGICNGFQILCEAGILPGVLLQNIGTRFISQFVHLKYEGTKTPFTTTLKKCEVFTCPIAHGEGNYFASADTIKNLEDKDRVLFRYCNPQGEVDASSREWNPNGALNAIAGIANEGGNVIGMMPHPERSSEKLVGWLGGDAGRKLFEAVAAS